MRYQQLQLFTRPVTAALRDRTKRRNYSPEMDEFRLEHARRRRWGLKRRHAQKLCLSQGCSRECAEVGLHDDAEAIPPLIWPAEATLTQRPAPAVPSPAVPAECDRPVDDGPPADRTVLAGRATAAARARTATAAKPAPRAEATTQTKPARPATSAARAETVTQTKPRTPGQASRPARARCSGRSATQTEAARRTEPARTGAGEPNRGRQTEPGQAVRAATRATPRATTETFARVDGAGRAPAVSHRRQQHAARNRL
jgi:hypothetical protein